MMDNPSRPFPGPSRGREGRRDGGCTAKGEESMDSFKVPPRLAVIVRPLLCCGVCMGRVCVCWPPAVVVCC